MSHRHEITLNVSSEMYEWIEENRGEEREDIFLKRIIEKEIEAQIEDFLYGLAGLDRNTNDEI